MQSPLQQTASNIRSIHLLRSLLREASYLPDLNARQYFRRYIVHRFKAYQPSQNATAPIDVQAVERYRHRAFKRRHISIINQRTNAAQHTAHKGLNYLRRANQGELSCLERVLFFTYGRMGRRRYRLLDELLRPESANEGPGSQAKPAPLHQLYYSNKRFLSFFDAPKQKTKDDYAIEISDRYPRLKIVLKTQVQLSLAIGRDLKRNHLVTPIRNIWERPMPIKRARNNVRRWYADTMSRLLPPLPNDEWDRLRALAAGEKRIEFAKPRTPAIELHSLLRDEDSHSKTLIENGLTLDRPSKADRPWGINRPHHITVRLMRRMYARVLTLSCKLEWQERRNNWMAIWGKKALGPRTYPTVDEALFAGVDASGQTPKVPRVSKTIEKEKDWASPQTVDDTRTPVFTSLFATQA